MWREALAFPNWESREAIVLSTIRKQVKNRKMVLEKRVGKETALSLRLSGRHISNIRSRWTSGTPIGDFIVQLDAPWQ